MPPSWPYGNAAGQSPSLVVNWTHAEHAIEGMLGAFYDDVYC